jgi:hypothetical protein
LLLGYLNGLRRIADLYAKRTAGGCDAEVLIAEATDQVERLLHGLLLREAQRIRRDLRLDRGAHVWRRAEEAVRRDRAVDALMRALKVVVLDEELDAAKAIREVREDRLTQKLLPQRLPETLDLPERLRMLGSALAVVDPMPAQELLKLRRSTPRGVLPTLVGQDLARLAVVRDAALQCLDHQTGLLVVRHRPRHEVPRVVIHEADHVHALMTPQLEREDVALPHLVRLGPFETTRRLVA